MHSMCSMPKKFNNSYLYRVNKMIDMLHVHCKRPQTLRFAWELSDSRIAPKLMSGGETA